MTRSTSPRALVLLLATGLIGCGTPSEIAAPIIGQADGERVVADLGSAGGKTLTIRLADPDEKDYHALATVHRWIAADINRYVVNLRLQTGASVGSPLATVNVLRQAPTPQTTAVFTNLKLGNTYQVDVQAWGAPGGGAATTALNAIPATRSFSFLGDQDVDDSVTTQMAVVLDPIEFNGKATVTLTSPDPGVYSSPAAGEAGSAL